MGKRASFLRILGFWLFLELGGIASAGGVVNPPGIALVIGNSAYPQAPLGNPGRDAVVLSGALQRLGFKVIVEVNADLGTMLDAVDRFVAGIRPGGVGFFYYSGHGIQLDGENYLLPIDFDATSMARAKRISVSAEQIREQMEERGSALNMLILDACRNNPFRSSKSASRGLAVMSSNPGTYIVFATCPGCVADDNPGGRNGLFTTYFLESLETPGLELDAIFKRVSKKVAKASGGRQIPWRASSFSDDFYFVRSKRERFAAIEKSGGPRSGLLASASLTPVSRVRPGGSTLASSGSRPAASGKNGRRNLVRNGDFSRHWSDGWEKNLDPTKGNFTVSVERRNNVRFLHGILEGENFAQITQAIELPLSGDLKKLVLEAGFRLNPMEGGGFLKRQANAFFALQFLSGSEENLGTIWFWSTRRAAFQDSGLVGAPRSAKGSGQSCIKSVGKEFTSIHEALLPLALDCLAAFEAGKVRKIALAAGALTQHRDARVEFFLSDVRLYFEE